MPRKYSQEFRRRVLDLVAAGRPVLQVASELGLSDQTIYAWRRQDRIDQGLEPGLSQGEQDELRSARRRIKELETQVAVLRRSRELLKESTNPKGCSRPSR